MSQICVDDLGVLEETALITLWSRAVESQSEHPILHDDKAVEIVSSIDYDFEKFGRFPPGLLGCCCRADALDGFVRRFLDSHADGVVVDIGAGLDTRFERLDNGRVRWFDLDLPDSMAVRRRFFEETERRRFIADSVLEPGWIDTIAALGADSHMFLAEGVLLYFSEDVVRRLFATLADRFPGSLFAFDGCSPLMRRTARLFDAVGKTRAKFGWGVGDIRKIETWDDRYKVLDVKQVLMQHRQRWPWWLRALTVAAPFTRNCYTVGVVRFGPEA